MILDLPFTPGTAAPPNLPLGRYLPPVPEGLLATWLCSHAGPGDWVLDPFGSTPQLALEAARAGFRVLVASNNPILTFMTEILAQAPARADLLAALADLSAARRGSERLELFFRSLYQTECTACHQQIQVEAYLWKRGETEPFARLYRCPHCGDEGERALRPVDLERLALPGNANLHLARALERVALAGDPLREGAQEVVQFFLPRALLFITTLINRMEGLEMPEPRRRLLAALALSVCDAANSLWPYPEARSRPRQLIIPPTYRENNLWTALQAAVEDWCLPGAAVPVTRWPELPPASGGICLYAGRMRSLLPLVGEMDLRQVAAVLPRPNQPFWTLSALWSGWLWGREALQPLRYALERQRYDWHWHMQALHGVFSALPSSLHFWAVLPEAGPGFLSAAVLAADAAGWTLSGLTMAADDEVAQLTWQQAIAPPQALAASLEAVVQRGMADHLRRGAEPAGYLTLHAAGLAALCATGRIAPTAAGLSAEAQTQLQNSFAQVLKTSGKFIHLGNPSSQNVETGLWWLAVAPPAAGELPLADRVEMELVKWLIQNPGCSFFDLQHSLNQLFPGLLTPPAEFLRACLDSYAQPGSGEPPGWQMRPAESPVVRRADLDIIGRGLARLGDRLNFAVSGGMPVIWKDAQGRGVYQFFPLASAIISKHIRAPQGLPAERCILVVPGSRVNLIFYKLQRDPSLAEALAAGWRFLKFRQLRQILDQPRLTLPLFESLIDGDPPRWEGATQPTML